MLAPIGEFPSSDGSVVQVIDQAAVRAMANAFSAGDELLIDFDHESHSSDKRTTAAGWIQNLLARSDGLFAAVKWSSDGAAAIKGGVYRYISPVWLKPDCEDLGNGRVRPLRLYDAGLTNRPNLKGIDALSNRDAEIADGNETENQASDKAIELPADATQRFETLVLNRKAAKNITFERAWEESKTLFRSTYFAMLQNCANQSGAVSAWANRFAFREKPPHPNDVEVGGMTSVNNAKSGFFLSIVERYQSEEGLKFERAWDKAKLMYPSEFNHYVSAADLLSATQKPSPFST